MTLSLAPAVALANGPILLSTHTYTWTDPDSGGQIDITEKVYYIADDDMKWEYTVYNNSYDPDPPYTNGLAGFQIVVDNPVERRLAFWPSFTERVRGNWPARNTLEKLRIPLMREPASLTRSATRQ